MVRKSLKNSGHEGSVKLLPRLASNGRGKDVDIGVAVAMVDCDIDEADEGTGMPDDTPDVAAEELLESSCRT